MFWYNCLDAFAFCCKIGLMLEPSHITVLITHNNKTGGFCRILTGLFNSIRKNISFFFYTKLSSIFCAYNMFIVSCILLTKHKNTRQPFGNLELLLNSLCARWLSQDMTQSSTNQSACISIIISATKLINNYSPKWRWKVLH